MAKVLKCGDVVPGCKEEIKGDSEHDVLRKAAEHAKTAHHMDSIPPDVLSKVKGAIHDEGDRERKKLVRQTRQLPRMFKTGGSQRAAFFCFIL